jgi:hypothetical protein
MLTGLTRDQFTLSTFVGQGDIIWSDAAGLTEALQRVADSQGGTATASTAIAVLGQALDRYDGITLASAGKVDTEIARCEKQIAEDRANLDLLERERESLADRIEAVSDRARAERVHALRRDVLRLRRLLREGVALQALLENDARDREQTERHEAELRDGGDWESLTPETLDEIRALRREREMATRMVQRAEEEADVAEAQRRLSLAATEEILFTRRPTEADHYGLLQAHHRIEDARRRRSRLEGDHVQEELALLALGVSVDEARELARAFREMHEEDRALLSGRTRTQAHLEERLADNEQQASRHRHLLEDVDRARGVRRRGGLALAFLGAVIGATGYAFADSLPGSLPSWSAPLPGALALLVGIALAVVAGRHRRRDEMEAGRQVEQLRNGLLQIEADRAEAEAQWISLAQRLGLQPEEIEPRYQDYRNVASHVDGLAVLAERIEEARHDEDVALIDVRQPWSLFDDEPRVELVSERVELVQRAMDLHREADQDAALASQAQRKVDQHRAALRRHEDALRELLATLGQDVEPGTDLDAFLEDFDQRADRARHLRHVRDEILPVLRSRLLDPERRSAQEERLEQIETEQRMLREGIDPALGLLGEEAAVVRAQLSEPLAQREYDEALAALDREEDDQRRMGEEERTSARAFLQRYELEAPRLRTSLDRHENALAKATQFRAAITLARDTLDEISRQTHRQWASALNRHANEILRALGSQVESLGFDESLGLRMVQEGRTLTGREAVQQLSSGAADAVYLAARIAVSRFLSRRREPLPLILDDPFANADDQRLLSGARLLLEAIAPQQQVLLMACQHSRYEWLRRELGHPEGLVTLRVDDEDVRSAAD